MERVWRGGGGVNSSAAVPTPVKNSLHTAAHSHTPFYFSSSTPPAVRAVPQRFAARPPAPRPLPPLLNCSTYSLYTTFYIIVSIYNSPIPPSYLIHLFLFLRSASRATAVCSRAARAPPPPPATATAALRPTAGSRASRTRRRGRRRAWAAACAAWGCERHAARGTWCAAGHVAGGGWQVARHDFVQQDERERVG